MMELEKVFDSLRGLHDFSKAINSTLNLGEVEELVMERTARLMDVRKVLILLLDETKTTLALHRSQGLDPIELQATIYSNIKAFDHCINNKGTVITINEVLTENDLQLQRQQMPFLSDMVFAPLEIKGEASGLLGISRYSQEFSSFELEMFCSIASQAAVALENANLYKKLRDDCLHAKEALAEVINSRASNVGGHT